MRACLYASLIYMFLLCPSRMYVPCLSHMPHMYVCIFVCLTHRVSFSGAPHVQVVEETEVGPDGVGVAGKDATSLASLEREIALCKRLRHRHIVGYIGAQTVSATEMYVFLEFVPGGSIASMLTRFGCFNEQLVRHYTRQLLLGLEYLHGCKARTLGVTHSQPLPPAPLGPHSAALWGWAAVLLCWGFPGCCAVAFWLKATLLARRRSSTGT